MTVEIFFEGAPVAAQQGESLFAALTAAGHLKLNETVCGAARGAYCGMGACHSCLVDIDGAASQRACMVKVTRPIRVSLARSRTVLADARQGAPPRRLENLPILTPDVLVIGAGPAGLTAAVEARARGADVMIIDEQTAAGGQYYKQLAIMSPSVLADRQHRLGAALIDKALAAGVDLRLGMTIWGAFPGPEYAATGDNRTFRIRPCVTILATGAHERAWPVAGWTEAGVMTTGAAQTLWRTARRLPGKRVLIAGNGPLNLQLAAELTAGGAQIVGLVEAAAAPSLRDVSKMARMAVASPALIAAGVRYLARIRDAKIPLFHDSFVTHVARDGGILTATIDGLAPRDMQADSICFGYGLRPSNALGRALGIAFHFDVERGYLVPQRSSWGETSIPGVYLIGDGAELGGAHIAIAEGKLAALGALDRLGRPFPLRDRRAAEAHLRRHQVFQKALWQLYSPTRPLTTPRHPDALICRCENVRFADVTAAIEQGYSSVGAIKQYTRLGMGRCQGRYCAPDLEELVGGAARNDRSGFAPRVPVAPVTIGDLAR